MSFHDIFNRAEPSPGRDLTHDYAQPGSGPRANSSSYAPAPYLGPSGGSGPSRGVGPVEAITLFFTNYVRFTGRASRSEYWWPIAFCVVATLVLVLMGLGFGVQPTFGTGAIPAPNGFGILVLLLLAALILGTWVPSIAVSVRRLHDADLPGWCYLANFLPYIGQVVWIVIGVLPPKPEGARFDR